MTYIRVNNFDRERPLRPAQERLVRALGATPIYVRGSDG